MKARIFLFALLAVAISCSKPAEDTQAGGTPSPTPVTSPPNDASTLAPYPLELSADALPHQEQPVPVENKFVTGYVIHIASLWNTGDTLTVCFIEGDSSIRQTIVSTASEWTAPGRANLKFDFGGAPIFRTCTVADESRIRIGFRGPGYNSFVGSDSVYQGIPGKATMNFQNFDRYPPERRYLRATILHEFGHALGLEHEHQSPKEGCDAEFSWPQVYAELAKPPNRWSSKTVDFNLRALPDSSAFYASIRDRLSIMHYHLDAWMFVKGEQSSCYVPQNYELSALDIEGIKKAYSSNPGADQAQRIALVKGAMKIVPPQQKVDTAFLTRAMAHMQRPVG